MRGVSEQPVSKKIKRRNRGGDYNSALVRCLSSDQRLRFAIDQAGVGTWDLDLATQELFFSDRTRALFGLSAFKNLLLDDFHASLGAGYRGQSDLR
ncbi:hypothetical protein Nham_4374 (plasmid) [Nitrobacter hamburgensis X14]|uniref:Uncharacterized protein n=1 Tax=Nitrobacter hamburgensis (strain DSM 10229 / NCIMB 13809 / X14) TaxID=323097 RepID=Q1QFN2_NITHX|nr:hypothetical protein Nham_4374 [Nitrobacter hamburgensis X14]